MGSIMTEDFTVPQKLKHDRMVREEFNKKRSLFSGKINLHSRRDWQNFYKEIYPTRRWCRNVDPNKKTNGASRISYQMKKY